MQNLAEGTVKGDIYKRSRILYIIEAGFKIQTRERFYPYPAFFEKVGFMPQVFVDFKRKEFKDENNIYGCRKHRVCKKRYR